MDCSRSCSSLELFMTSKQHQSEAPPGEHPGAPPSLAASLPSPRWHSRGYLPHFEHTDRLQSITFRLHDALPQSKLEQWKQELRHLPENERTLQLRRLIEKHLDAGHGTCWLRQEPIGKIVGDALLFFDNQRYNLLVWCVMPNHMHALIEPKSEWSLGDLAHSWKSYTASKANKLLGRVGPFWQREYHDRFIRDGEHFENVLQYIENNPVKAGLVSIAEQWPFSSARWSRRFPDKPIL